MPFSCRLLALALNTAFLPFLDFFDTPAPWCTARTEGRFLVDSLGGWTFFSDLSVSMLGEDARFAAREWTEVTAR
jgi:hypothetical protein